MPLVQALPTSAERYAAAQRAEIGAAVAATGRLWRRMGGDFDASYASIGPSLLTVVETAQARVAAGAVAYVPAVLEETGQRRAVAAVADVVPESLVGYAGDGRRIDGLVGYSTVRAKVAVAEGATARQALSQAGQWLSMAVATALSDTGRAAESVAMAVRPVGGYVRMLNPPSCSRCALLAGQVYGSRAPFQRHPGCDCRHIPAAESVAADLTVDTRAYFESLPPTDQDRIFTKAGAEAIRNGADIGRVVNARRGMTKAQSGRLIRDARGQYTTRTGYIGARRSQRSPRLMPEGIAEVARDKADYLRLLRANGYIR